MLKLAPLWKCAEVKTPGNILVLGGKGRPARLLVIENFNSLAEVGLDGKVIAVHKFNLEEKREFVCNLRAFTAANDKSYIAGFATAQQRLHLLDPDGKETLAYPKDALTSPHSGIADVQLGDLDGDGTPKIYVGYLGIVGVQAASLEGNRLWSNRTVSNVTHLAIEPPADDGRGRLVCASLASPLVEIDAEGKTYASVGLPDQRLLSLLIADLQGNGHALWCGLTVSPEGKNMAVGLSVHGEPLWQYMLPDGVPQSPIELIIAGNVTGKAIGQWILPGADGSIHFLSADGLLFDKFNYGVTLQGLATVQVDGQPVLVVASANGLEAWKVQ